MNQAASSAPPPYRYTAALADQIETGWQDKWEQQGTFHAPNPAGSLADPTAVAAFASHQLILDMFPYPSGAGLHVGHPLGYIATDVTARYQRMLGKNVLHCLGYDAFGLPAELYAVQTGQHPRLTTEANMAVMKRQLRRLGLGHDDRRTISTIDPGYYKWTQWIFLQIWNSWYDQQATRADGGVGKARPISELIEELQADTRKLGGDFAGRSWTELSLRERADYLDTQRLAYTSHAPVNWAPGLGTVLSNEEVTADGRSERGNFPVYKTNLRQWMMRITTYADRLVEDLDRIDWPEKVKAMQRNWIGRSEGAAVRFPVTDTDQVIEVFTTRPDTLFGATFMVLAPEHPLLEDSPASVLPQQWPHEIPTAVAATWTGGATHPRAAVAAYQLAAARKSDVERQKDDKVKSGVFTGCYARNPVSGARIPIFVADYVLMGYGTGAVMAVPGHDQRDWDFATAYQLPIICTVQAPADHPADRPYLGDGATINSTGPQVSLDGLNVAQAKRQITDYLEAADAGQRAITYLLRDWLFSRQRYWGEPFPIVYDQDGAPHALPMEMLPVELPDVPNYSPTTFDPDDTSATPEAPLSRATDWVNVTLDLGDGPRQYRRETNTMPNWAGSCWYYLRYLDPGNESIFVDPDTEAYWMGPRAEALPGAPAGTTDPGGVDLYVGGVEHAVLHLLYARFWHKVLHDLGHLRSQEPFRRYFSQGYIQAYAYRDERGQPVPASEVEPGTDSNGQPTWTWQDKPVTREFGKIGKSLKNAVSPDEMYATYGADTFRVYEMSMGPLELSKPWETRAVVGAQRFLQRLWRNLIDENTGALTVVDTPVSDELERIMHATIAAVHADYDSLAFNTAIARLIEFNNELTKAEAVPRVAAETLVLMVAPVAPHIAEELWQRLGHPQSLAREPFPVADPEKLIARHVTCVIQVSGKVRDRIEVPADITADALRELALARPRVSEVIGGGVRTVIVKEPKLVNVVPA